MDKKGLILFLSLIWMSFSFGNSLYKNLGSSYNPTLFEQILKFPHTAAILFIGNNPLLVGMDNELIRITLSLLSFFILPTIIAYLILLLTGWGIIKFYKILHLLLVEKKV